jgi:hypothetical protein
MTDDFLSPDDHTPPAGADTEEHLAEDVGLDPSDDDEDDDDDDDEAPSVGADPGITPPD